MLLCPRCSAPAAEAHAFCYSCGAELAQAAQRMTADPLLGRILPGGYRVTHLVGVGGMGRVYCADQVALGRTVAVKVVHPHLAHDELATSRFLNEARAASRLSHPNSVAIFDFGRTEEGQPYIVMEYLRGGDLGRVVEADGRLPLRRVVDILGQTLAALAEAHALGIVHRDLKPDNIVLEPRRTGVDFVKVVDFGLAKLLEEEAGAHGDQRKLTRPGLVCGTPEYMSPEQGRGDPLDGRADLYSVGVILFELLTGRVPFVAETATKTLLMHLSDPAPDPCTFAPDREIPAAFANVTLRALAKDAVDRYQDAHAFSKALEAALLESEGRIADAGNQRTAIRCRSCGVLNPSGQKFCGDCGKSIAPASAAGGTAPPPRVSRAPVPSITPGHPPTRAQGPTPLIARESALEWLDTKRREGDSEFKIAHLVGEEGVGKTRLVDELVAVWESRGDLVVRVGPDPTWAKIRDFTLRAAVRALVGLPEGRVDPSLWRDAESRARRGLGLLFGERESAQVPPEERRELLANALRWALHRTRARVLVLDDVDFIDGTSRSAFTAILDAPPEGPLLAVLAYTPSRAGTREPRPEDRLVLDPLPRESIAHLLPAGVPETGPPLTALHFEQLVAWSQESREPPPEHLADLVARRIERLPSQARSALGALVVWGDDVQPEVLAKMLPPETNLAAALEALKRAGLAFETDRGVRTAHALIRRVAFASVPVGRRGEFFELAARLRPDAPLEIRAKQALYVGTAFEALAQLDTLGSERAAHGDVSGSVSTWRRALDFARRELHRDELDDPVGAMLIFARKLAEALAATEKWSDAEGVLREALGNAPPNSEHRARLLGVLARVASARRQPDQARRYVDEAMKAARQCGASDLLPNLEELARSMAAVA